MDGPFHRATKTVSTRSFRVTRLFHLSYEISVVVPLWRQRQQGKTRVSLTVAARAVYRGITQRTRPLK